MSIQQSEIGSAEQTGGAEETDGAETDTAAAGGRIPAQQQRPASGADPVLSLRGAAVRVGGRTLWSGVDLTVGAGEFTAVLGPNGVGKSTLVKVLLGVLPPAAGEVTVLGGAPGARSSGVGYLPQRRNFDASVRIRGLDVVRLGLDGDKWGIPIPGLARFKRRRAARLGGPGRRLGEGRRGGRAGGRLRVRAPADRPVLRR